MAHELKIYGRTYELTVGVENYAKVREEFEELAWNYGKLYVKDIEKPGLSMAALIKNGYEAAEKYFEKAADDVLDRLAEHGVYTVKHQDIERMAEQYGVLDAFDKGFYAVAEAYYKIVGRAEEEKLQRQIRKESRGRVVGGGFGLKGAAQGMIQAGLLNGVTGLGHSIFNAIGNARTEREKRERLDALYPVAYGVLQNAFKASVSNYYLLLVSLLDEFGIFEFELPEEQDKELAKALLENLSAGRVPKDMVDEILYEIVTLNPYQIESYEYILENYGDKKNELEKFAKAHGISIASIKDVIFDDMFYSDVMDLCNDDEIKKDPVKYEKKLVALQNKMEKQKKKMSFAGETECEGIIKKELKTLGENYKTIDGVVFQTMGEVKAARKDLKTFYDYISIHGIESESVGEEIKQLEFETDIVTANLDERLQEMKKLTNDGFLGNCVGKAFNRNGFSLSVHSDSSFAEKVSVIGVSRNFTAVAEIARDLAEISENEKIVLIFRNETWSANGFLWCVLTNENLYMFESKGDAVEKKKVVPFLSIESIHADWKGNLVTSIKDEVDRTDKMELGNEFREDAVQEKFSRAMEEILHLIAPLTKGRLTAKEMARKQEKKEQFEREIAEATDITKAKKVVKAINSDKILGEEEKNAFLAKAQQRLDKFQNAETNARELKQMVSAIGKNDLTGINNALNQLLKSDLYDDNDKKAITDLIEMQLEFGSKWYAKELNNFFDQNRASSHLIQGKPVYMKKNSEETAGKLCDFFIRISPELEKGEVPLVFFKNDRRRPLPPAPPYAEEGMISNRRVFISFWGNGYKVFELNNLEINQMFLEQGYKIRANGELLSFGFPYVKLEEITDKTYRRKLKSALGERESVIVAAELNRFITGVMERNAEIKTGMARPVELPKASVTSKPAAGETPKPRVAETPKPSAEETAKPVSAEKTPKSVGVEEKPKVVCMEETEKKASMAIPKCSVSEMAEFIDQCPKLKKGVFISRTDYDFWKKLKKILKRCEGKVKEEDVFALFIQREDEKIKEGLILTTKGIVKKQRSDFAVMNFAYSDIIGFSMLHSNVIANYTSMHIVMPQGPRMIAGLLGKEGSKELANRIIAIVMHLYGLEKVPYSIEESMYENKLW